MRRIFRTVLFVLALLGAVQVAVTCTPLLKWQLRYLTGPEWAAPAGDVLIVLGAEPANPGDTLGYGTYWRCHIAVWAWRNGTYKRGIVSGGNGIAATMADYLVSHGVPPSAIQPESASLTTAENARFCARLVREGGFRRPDLLTSDFHMRRASAAFRKAGVNPRCIPAPDAGKRYSDWLDRWSVFLLLSNETVKLAWYSVRGFV